MRKFIITYDLVDETRTQYRTLVAYLVTTMKAKRVTWSQWIVEGNHTVDSIFAQLISSRIFDRDDRLHVAEMAGPERGMNLLPDNPTRQPDPVTNSRSILGELARQQERQHDLATPQSPLLAELVERQKRYGG